jgi:protein NrfD
MNAGLPSTWFTAAPHWGWLIVFYFFIGGLAGGSYFLAVLLDFFGRLEDRPLARLGYYVAFPATIVCAVLLAFDLGRPVRFWHMLFESNTGIPMFKAYSPMSAGSWALFAFGLFAFIAFVAALREAGRLPGGWLGGLRPPRLPGSVLAVLGGFLAFYVAGYTGVLLGVTNRPIWADTPLLGLNFVVSAASTSAALLILLAGRRWRFTTGLLALERFDATVLVLELLALLALLGTLGSVLRVWLNGWGLLLLLGTIVFGILVPLALQWRSRWRPGGAVAWVAAVLVLVGGFIFRVVIVLSAQGIGAA